MTAARTGHDRPKTRRFMDHIVQYQTLTGALIPDTLLSADYNLFLSSLGPLQTNKTLTDASNVLYVGEQTSLDSRNTEILGSGTAQPGVQLLSLVIPTGTQVDVIYMRDLDSGELILTYPGDAPNLLSAIALVLTIDEVGYDMQAAAPLCFVKGTRLMTPGGPRPVERLAVGDMVLDWSGRPVRVLACPRSHYDTPPEAWRPVVVEADAFGPGLPERRLKVSPQHRICLPDSNPADPALAPAKSFTRLRRIRYKRQPGPVTYLHLVTERHALLWSEGIPSESLLLARCSLLALEPGLRRRLLGALGVTPGTLASHPAASPCGTLLTVTEGRRRVEIWARRNRHSPITPWTRDPGPTCIRNATLTWPLSHRLDSNRADTLSGVAPNHERRAQMINLDRKAALARR